MIFFPRIKFYIEIDFCEVSIEIFSSSVIGFWVVFPLKSFISWNKGRLDSRILMLMTQSDQSLNGRSFQTTEIGPFSRLIRIKALKTV